MKIAAVSMVKNESDIIESFIRHTLTFCDELIVYDDNSADGTARIIKALQDEGLNLSSLLYDNPKRGRYQEYITNLLISVAVNKCSADFIIPLDADEFLVSNVVNANINVRDLLVHIASIGEYAFAAPHIHFVPTVFERQNNVFLPEYFTEHYDYNNVSEQYDTNKIMFSSKLVKEHNATINPGNHNLFWTNGDEVVMSPKKFVPELILAHLPYRNTWQMAAKAIIKYTGCLLMPDHKVNPQNQGNLYCNIYRKFKSEGILSEDDVRKGSAEESGAMPITGRNLNKYVWNSGIELKYTDYAESQRAFMNIILTHYENIIAGFMEGKYIESTK